MQQVWYAVERRLGILLAVRCECGTSHHASSADGGCLAEVAAGNYSAGSVPRRIRGASVIGMFVVAAVYVEQDDAPVLFWVFYGLAYVFGFAVGIWVLVDFIIAVTGNFKDKQGKPIKRW